MPNYTLKDMKERVDMLQIDDHDPNDREVIPPARKR